MKDTKSIENMVQDLCSDWNSVWYLEQNEPASAEFIPGISVLAGVIVLGPNSQHHVTRITSYVMAWLVGMQLCMYVSNFL